MDELEEVWSGLVTFTASRGLLSVAAIQFVKSAGVPLPVPIGLLAVLLGAQAREGTISLWLAWLTLTLASSFGVSLLFAVVRWISPGDLLRYGRFIGLTEQLLQRAEAELDERGQPAIFVARLVPGLGLAIVVVCAVLGFPFRKFWPAVTLAAVIYTGAWLALGFVFGPAVVDTLEQIVLPVGLLVRVIAIAALLVWLVRARKAIVPRPARPRSSPRRRLRAGALAGVLAVGGATTIINALIYLAGPIAGRLLTPSGTVIALVSRFPAELLYVLTLIVVVTALGIAWGVLYSGFEDRYAARLRDWQQGLLFAVFPLGMSLLSVLPVVVSSGADSPWRWLSAAMAEALLWALYGSLLGLMYPIFNSYAPSNHDVSVGSVS
ncbi:MAG: VTT domain-containing protein [Chloroflexi bacterium]|nr:VTT domain-containing protein [Chloroflexota bacterium]